MKFLHCYVGYPGSIHDQSVFLQSDVQDICNNHEQFPDNTHLIGDEAYAIQQHLLVPYCDNNLLTIKQKNYNRHLSASLTMVDRSIALLKERFRSLLDKLPMRRIDLIPNYVMACCVMHNICLLQGDTIDVPEIVRNESFVAEKSESVPQLHQEGVEKRIIITNHLPLVED